MSCLINEEIMERLYEDFLELGYCEEDAVELAHEEFNKEQKGGKYASKCTTKKLYN